MIDSVRLGFIGCGGIVRGHLAHGLAHFEDVEFAGWCDLNAQTAAERREEAGGGEIFTDVEKMLDQVELDAVYIMLPPFAHGLAEELVLQRELPFFIEKPVTIDVDLAEKVADEVSQKQLITSVGYMNRYRRSVQRVRELLAEQEPVLMYGGWTGGGVPAGADLWRWWVQKDKSGGQFLEQTTHTTDLARYLFGEVQTVYAVPVYDRQPRPDIYTIEDASMVQLSFANGAAANLYSSCTTPVGGGVSLTVYATQMKAEFTGWDHDVTVFLADSEQITVPGGENIFAREDRAFVDSVKAGQPQGILATYEDGLQAIRIAVAADQSMKTGQPVSLET